MSRPKRGNYHNGMEVAMKPQKQPAYLKHLGPDGKLRARTRINGKDIFLGAYGSPESHEKYKAILAQWAAGDIGKPSGELLICEAVAMFLRHLEGKVRPDDLSHYRQALRPVNALFGSTTADKFGPKKLRACLEELAKSYVRRLVNRYLRRIRDLFSWLVREERIPATVTHALAEVPGLARGEAGVREHKTEVLPVPPGDLWKTLRHLSPRFRAMVRLQVRTGMRPGELCRIQADDIEQGGRVEIRRGVWLPIGKCWLYRPAKHKTEYAGHKRFIIIGPRAQGDLAPYIEHDGLAGCFAVSGAEYGVSSYYHAIQRACERAGVEPWYPHQLRHNAASRLAAEFGWEVTRIVLGHRSFQATQVYVLDDLTKAVAAMGKAG